MTLQVYPYGRQTVAVAASGKIAVTSNGPAKLYLEVGYPNQPNAYQLLYATQPGESYTSAALTTAANVIVEAFASPVFYESSVAPGIGLPLFYQPTPTAKTVSSTMTAADIKAGLITINQGAAGASAQQLPLASAMDTACPDFLTNSSFYFTVINTSTVDAEDASITTNTGWTLVGAMDIPAYNASGSLNSSARFLARKTGTATWVLYRA